MRFSPVPLLKYKCLCDIMPDDLKKRGIKLLLLDVDNTISPYKINKPTEKVLAWAEMMKKEGIRLFIVSNNKGDRPQIFSELMGIPFLKRAKKPSCRGIMKAMAEEGTCESETALVGDQVYTDMLAANRAGITGILVEPIKFTNIFLAIRYFFELPFRHENHKMGVRK